MELRYLDRKSSEAGATSNLAKQERSLNGTGFWKVAYFGYATGITELTSVVIGRRTICCIVVVVVVVVSWS
jgi:hypothetical protein